MYRRTIILLFTFILIKPVLGQGKVVINEYMPWTLNGCGATAEFVELLNFGPGPVNIGCYILTDGDYSVTIPPNTILQPGQFYVIAGQDVIPGPCANIDSTITTDLNWNSCGCTSGNIPETGDGFFTDGGSANEQIVLLNPQLQVVDAVIRSFPAEPSSWITTSSMAGCESQTFDLDEMDIRYETLGMSTGRGNSFARKLDGDCGWVKDPQQSASATNNTPGDVSDVSYEFYYVNAMDCSDNHGGISIYVKKDRYENFFPMYYTLVYDSDDDGDFDFEDEYTFGKDETPPDIFISGLPGGRYRITVESMYGCGLKTFDFIILPCMPALPVQLEYFRPANTGSHSMEWLLTNTGDLHQMVLEKASPTTPFTTAREFPVTINSARIYQNHTEPQASAYTRFRLKLVLNNGEVIHSPILDLSSKNEFTMHGAWPVPAGEHINIRISAATTSRVPWFIYNTDGRLMISGFLDLKQGINTTRLQTGSLPLGIYQLKTGPNASVSLRFVKH